MITFIKKKIQKSLNKFGYEIVNKNQTIVELSNDDKNLINLVNKYSMTPKIRIYNLLQSLRHLKHKNVKGDYVECGVWKGGNLILFKKFLENEKVIEEVKSIYGFDTFEGMTEPDENDFQITNKIKAKDLFKTDAKKSSH